MVSEQEKEGRRIDIHPSFRDVSGLWKDLKEYSRRNLGWATYHFMKGFRPDTWYANEEPYIVDGQVAPALCIAVGMGAFDDRSEFCCDYKSEIGASGVLSYAIRSSRHAIGTIAEINKRFNSMSKDSVTEFGVTGNKTESKLMTKLAKRISEVPDRTKKDTIPVDLFRLSNYVRDDDNIIGPVARRAYDSELERIGSDLGAFKPRKALS